MFLNDARIYQILFLSLFLVLGIGTRDWTLRPTMILTTIATCLVTQWVAIVVTQYLTQSETQEPSPPLRFLPSSSFFFSLPSSLFLSSFLSSLPSALITGLGLSLLLRADHYSTVILAAAIAILSKFVLRIKGKHIFNPGNFGIIAALLLTHDAWVSPGQWGEEGWYALLFLGAGGIVLERVGRWDTTVTFLGTYAGLEAIRNLWLGWTWDVWAHRLMSGSLLLFALFMVTDPRTIPNARSSRCIWAMAIALLTFILRNYFFISTAVFWALFTLAPLTILLDYIWTAPRFSWFKPGEQPTEIIEEVNCASLPLTTNH
jgi:Na+-transporting NADH:ubiquinone oxidoreductase subunit NqrB